MATDVTPVVSSGAAEVVAPPASPRRVLVTIAAVMLGMFVAALDQTIVATALSTIVADLGGLEHLSWVVTAYLLATTATTALWGKLGDLYGRRLAFQASLGIFLVGSLLCGASRTMGALIASRALQGIGGGGLIVTAQGIIGEVVAPRDRGRYQGFFGAVFGVTSVIGPIVGGFLVDTLSWHWVFLVNLPIGAVAMAVAAATLPAPRARAAHVIDYAGAALIAAATTAIVLLTTLAESGAGWRSPGVRLLAPAALALVVLFVLAERRAREPVLPLVLFRQRNFRVATALALFVGMALVGPATVLPVYLQRGGNLTPTASGLHMLPLLLAVPLASITSGQIISRTGRYRAFPIAGTGLQLAGLALMAATVDGGSAVLLSAAMALLGVGLGMTMQVLILAVQNSVEYRHLGASTSGVTLFRALGSVFGAALFGGTFASGLAAHASSAAAIERVFLLAVPFAALAFLISWWLEEIPLRATSRVRGVDESVGVPAGRGSAQQMALLLSRLVDGENRREVYIGLARAAGVALPPPLCWLLFRLGELTAPTLATVQDYVPLEAGALAARLDALAAAGLAAIEPTPVDPAAPPSTARVTLTPQGREALERLVAVREARLAVWLDGWSPERSAELLALMRGLARVLVPDTDDAEER